MPKNQFFPHHHLKSKKLIKRDQVQRDGRSARERGAGLNEVFKKNLTEFEKSILGDVVLKSDPEYEEAKEIFNNFYELQFNPEILVYCENIHDVQLSIKFANDNSLQITPRSGGHSTAGYCLSNGMIIDLHRLNYAVIDEDDMIATVGGGTNFGTFNSILDFYDLHVPGGGCLSVRVGGFMQGGGYGLTSRLFGMNCDNVIQVKMVLADGSIVVANKDKNQDLFWAVRGGTGNNFGILVEVTYQLHRLNQSASGTESSIWGFKIFWQNEDVAKALFQFQKILMDSTFSCFGFQGGIMLDPQSNLNLFIMGVYNGPREIGFKILTEKFLSKTQNWNIPTSNDISGTYSDVNNVLVGESDDAIGELAGYAMQSEYIDKELELEDWEELMVEFKKVISPMKFIIIEGYGEVINKKTKDYNAFVHRKVLMDFAVSSLWSEQANMNSALKWLDSYMKFVEKVGCNESYQNYPRAGLKDFAVKYWGSNYPRLRKIKTLYDPGNSFHFEQSIELVD